MRISAPQTPIAVVFAHDTKHAIFGTHVEQACPRPASNAKARPYFTRVLLVEHERIVRRRAALALTLLAQRVFRGSGIDEYAPTLEAHLEAQSICMCMGGQMVRPDRGDIANEEERR